VHPDPERYCPETATERLAAKGLTFKDYQMMAEMADNTLVIDDISQYETEKMIDIYKPAIFCAGIKEKYAIQKKGIPMKQLHSYDSGGPYAGFRGAANFYREIDRMVNSKIWSCLAPGRKVPNSRPMRASEGFKKYDKYHAAATYTKRDQGTKALTVNPPRPAIRAMYAARAFTAVSAQPRLAGCCAYHRRPHPAL
jgi:hypothetical protein